MVRRKAKYMRRLGLGGGMIWALDLDDFKDHCGEGVHPLLTELQSVLAEPANEIDERPDTTVIEPTTESYKPDGEAEIIEELPHEGSDIEMQSGELNVPSSSTDSDFKVVCYFTNWVSMVSFVQFFFGNFNHFISQIGMVSTRRRKISTRRY